MPPVSPGLVSAAPRTRTHEHAPGTSASGKGADADTDADADADADRDRDTYIQTDTDPDTDADRKTDRKTAHTDMSVVKKRCHLKYLASGRVQLVGGARSTSVRSRKCWRIASGT